jgi:hypothetical protein
LKQAGFDIVQIHEPKVKNGERKMQLSHDRVIEARLVA